MDESRCFTVRTLLNLRDSIAADKTFNSTSFQHVLSPSRSFGRTALPTKACQQKLTARLGSGRNDVAKIHKKSEPDTKMMDFIIIRILPYIVAASINSTYLSGFQTRGFTRIA